MNIQGNHSWFRRGIRDGIPIGLGYLAVSFTLGIAAGNAGMASFPAAFMSLTNLTSAGEFAALGLMTAGAAYVEMAGTQLIINLRYLLMSCALSQKLSPGMPFYHRLLMAYGITDEIFGIAVGAGKVLNPFYVYGALAVAVPGWTLGTWLGVVSGDVLPGRILSALNVAIYGMFIAIIIPPARKERIVAVIVAISMGASLLFTRLPVVSRIPSGMRIIILTVLIAGAGAVLCPIKEETPAEEGGEEEGKETGGGEEKGEKEALYREMENQKEQEEEAVYGGK